MKRATKIWLVLAILSTVYLVYIAGQAVIITPGYENHFVLNLFNVNNTDSAIAVLNWTALVSIVLWIIWSVLFVWQ